jgi:eukaryotic-like serine/threonine-protein kinase
MSEMATLEAGSRFDAFELMSLISRGGMANVWLARRTMKHGLSKLVAIKTILPEYSLDPQFRAMFLDEARIACRIHHPNVAQLLDVGETYGQSYIVMEYVSGESLARLRRAFAREDKTLPIDFILRVVADLSAGLHAAHELNGDDGNALGVVHRDVSPQNVLLSDAGEVKLIDFGVAKARGRLGGETSAGLTKGKARYMAPEQALSRPLDRRADIWAVGAMLHELVLGRPPFEGDNDIAVLRQLLGSDPVPDAPDSVPAPVRAIIKRALSRDPQDRYATAAEMRAAVEEAMDRLDFNATPATIERVCHEVLGERIEARRSLIEECQKAADERAKLRERVAALPHVDELISTSGAGVRRAPEDGRLSVPLAFPLEGEASETAHPVSALAAVKAPKRTALGASVLGLTVIAVGTAVWAYSGTGVAPSPSVASPPATAHDDPASSAAAPPLASPSAMPSDAAAPAASSTPSVPPTTVVSAWTRPRVPPAPRHPMPPKPTPAASNPHPWGGIE